VAEKDGAQGNRSLCPQGRSHNHSLRSANELHKKRRAKPTRERVFRVAYVAGKLDKEPEHQNLVLADLLEQFRKPESRSAKDGPASRSEHSTAA